MQIIDSGKTQLPFFPNTTINIPNVYSFSQTETDGYLVVGEFGLNVIDPPIHEYNTTFFSFVIGIKSVSNQDASINIIVAIAPTNDLSDETIIFSTEKTIRHETYDSISINSSYGGINNSIMGGYYRYRLYTALIGSVPNNDVTIIGPISFQATSYISEAQQIVQLGSTGPTGATGPAGYAGQTGETGPTGSVGSIGSTGTQGQSGNVGPTGANGFAGQIGHMGASGIDGIEGIIGPTGASGHAGEMGLTGPTGSSITGVIGPIGPTGERGATGMTGPTGSTGKPSSRHLVCFSSGNKISLRSGDNGNQYGTIFGFGVSLDTNIDITSDSINLLSITGSSNAIYVVPSNSSLRSISFSISISETSQQISLAVIRPRLWKSDGNYIFTPTDLYMEIIVDATQQNYDQQRMIYFEQGAIFSAGTQLILVSPMSNWPFGGPDVTIGGYANASFEFMSNNL